MVHLIELPIFGRHRELNPGPPAQSLERLLWFDSWWRPNIIIMYCLKMPVKEREYITIKYKND